mmetsp:Transcript_6281/g.10661  ORF Transcript_6281/g.10661 Transcript_6281/m.10661 type:complete len:271 (+) Transcript_6281:1298-2110(+)
MLVVLIEKACRGVAKEDIAHRLVDVGPQFGVDLAAESVDVVSQRPHHELSARGILGLDEEVRGMLEQLVHEGRVVEHSAGKVSEDLKEEAGVSHGEAEDVREVEGELVGGVEEVGLGAQELQNLLLLGAVAAGREHDVAEGLHSGDHSFLSDLEGHQGGLGGDRAILGDVGGRVLELAVGGEVELEGLLLRGVGLEAVLLAVDVLGTHEREAAVGDLEEERNLLGLRGDVGHDDLALVGAVHHHLSHLRVRVAFARRVLLVAVRDHDVVL